MLTILNLASNNGILDSIVFPFSCLSPYISVGDLLPAITIVTGFSVLKGCNPFLLKKNVPSHIDSSYVKGIPLNWSNSIMSVSGRKWS